MRIGLFTNNYRPLINGLTTSVDTFAGAFRRAGHDVTIVAPRYGAGGTDCRGASVVNKDVPLVRTAISSQRALPVNTPEP